MRHTQENLERLNDLVEELNKQLRHLKRQAEAAERYTDLKQQERTLQAEIKVLNWQTLNQQLSEQENPLAQCQLVQEQQLAKLRELETSIEKSRLDNHQANAIRDEAQKQYYGLGTEIARLEQRLQNLQEQMLRWRKEQEQAEFSLQELEEHTEEQRQHIEELTEELIQLQPQVAAGKQAVQGTEQTIASRRACYAQRPTTLGYISNRICAIYCRK